MGNRLATIDIGRKLGAVTFGGEELVWPGPRPTSLPSGILIHPTVWSQYTNVTDRQTGQTGQRSDSIGRTVFTNGRPKLK